MKNITEEIKTAGQEGGKNGTQAPKAWIREPKAYLAFDAIFFTIASTSLRSLSFRLAA